MKSSNLHKVRTCNQAKNEHDASCRQFAHVFHKKNTICVAPAFYDLPAKFRYGILLHELGHLAYGKHAHTEADADRMAFILSGIHVYRRTLDSSWEWAKNMETVKPADVHAAKSYLEQYLD